MILTKINTKSSDKTLNQLPGTKKNYLYQSRLDNLHSKVRDLFLKEQNRVLNKVEQEK